MSLIWFGCILSWASISWQTSEFGLGETRGEVFIAHDQESFLKDAKEEIKTTPNETVATVIEEVPNLRESMNLPVPKQSDAESSEKLNTKRVARWEMKEKIDSKDHEGCGFPVCVLIDSRPKRFSSLCSFMRYLKFNHLQKRFFHVQKGDCADVIEHKLLASNWGTKVENCKCTNGTCGNICIGSGSKAKTFKDVCAAMGHYWDKKDVVTVHMALGDCGNLLRQDQELYTEWFDSDEPCQRGDIESGYQILQMGAIYRLTGHFRYCPRSRRVASSMEIATLDGADIPDDQNVQVDLQKEIFQCINSRNRIPLKTPYRWMDKKIKCRDYKIRFKCKCSFGCSSKEVPYSRSREVVDSSQEHEISLPATKTLFDECDWKEFISMERPGPNTWDNEDRGTANTKKKIYRKHVCGSSPFNAMYIDSRRVDDDLPWDETGDSITKNTPNYGLVCIQENNKLLNRSCSNYKVRYCCMKEEPNQWGAWGSWSTCTKTCGGGMATRKRMCTKREGKEDCFGSWVELDSNGKDKYGHLKEQTKKCHEEACPQDAKLTPWLEWEACPVTCGPANKRRRRGCDPARQGGQECPKGREHYQESKDCNNDACPDPQWTSWSEWTKCSLTCGLGKKQRTRECRDANNFDVMMTPGLDCLGGSCKINADCKQLDCPINGGFTEWQNWGACSQLCGNKAFRVRRRYCTNPVPQFGGETCEGEKQERSGCPDLKPCPINCLWSIWGNWSPCDITCGSVGHGKRMRMRHIAIKAQYGGEMCDGLDEEVSTCIHKRSGAFTDEQKRSKHAIGHCPIHCEWNIWGTWTGCPSCYSDENANLLQGHKQVRQRSMLSYARFGGNPCKPEESFESRAGFCTPKVVPTCPKEANVAWWGAWSHWSHCMAKCSTKGKQKRSRSCNDIQQSEDECKGVSVEEKDCKGLCTEAGYSEWTAWNQCPVTCGIGRQSRRKVCRQRGKMDRLIDCKAEMKENRPCDKGPCGSKEDIKHQGEEKPANHTTNPAINATQS